MPSELSFQPWLRKRAPFPSSCARRPRGSASHDLKMKPIAASIDGKSVRSNSRSSVKFMYSSIKTKNSGVESIEP